MKEREGKCDYTREAANEFATRIGADLDAQCGPEFLDGEQAQKDLTATAHEKSAATSA
jgi:hypothetical protein